MDTSLIKSDNIDPSNSSNSPIEQKNLARVMRAARKQMGMNQIELSKRLGISQAKLSKVENALNVPTAVEWINFCLMAGISPDSIKTGFIESLTPAKLRSTPVENGFDVPAHYASMRGSKVRAMLPLMRYFEASYGPAKLKAFLKEKRLDPDFFVNLDNQLNINFSLDLMRVLVSDGKLKAKGFAPMVQAATESALHGGLARFYEKQNDSISLLDTLLAQARKYECNTSYSIESQTATQFDLSIAPEEHLQYFKYKDDPVLENAVCEYKKAYFGRFTGFQGVPRQAVEIHERECHFRGAKRCLYQIKVA